ncbi:MAG: hypothetical protein AAF570_27760, partial [Bacteroidota bacterium]
DFSMNLIVSVGQPEKNSRFQVIFRKAGDRHLALEFNQPEEEIRLVSVKGKRRKVLKKEPLNAEFFANSTVLKLDVQGNSINCASFSSDLLSYEGKDVLQQPGRFGFSATEVRLVLHQMTVNSSGEDVPDATAEGGSD